MRLTSWVLAAYGALGALGALLAVAFGQSPIMRASWLEVSGIEAAVASLVLGVCGAALAVILTRVLFTRAKWARALHDKLRPLVRFEDDGVLWVMAIASSIGEELFFRGFLSVTIGIWLSSLAFGLLHQVRGAGRFGWAGSAFTMGLFLSLLYALTGQLVGCIVAHAIVN
ncbi:MAG TPA: CPBP family intramembrane glutamic endopeptidase, partial [Polyangiaceae bacterium]|nr:CPBP family intramembrane glutamic endopeptidase [Polyangiaceae bacterium]